MEICLKCGLNAGFVGGGDQLTAIYILKNNDFEVSCVEINVSIFKAFSWTNNYG